MAEQLSQLESSVYHYLLDFTAEHTYQPSIRDIGKQFKIKSTKTVSDVLQALAKKGYIERDPSRSRGVKLVGFGMTARSQPVPYRAKTAPTDAPAFVTIDRRFLPSTGVFFGRADGDLRDHAIANGDYVMVNSEATPSDGDLVFAEVGGRSVVRETARRGEQLVLRAASNAESDVTADDATVLGVVCGVFRPFVDRPDATATLTTTESFTVSATA